MSDTFDRDPDPFDDERSVPLTAMQLRNSHLIDRMAELTSRVVVLTLELARYKEREKTMGWNQS